MKRSLLLSFVPFGMVTAIPAWAQELDYYLPKAVVAAGWQARLVHCPDGRNPNPEVVAQSAIAGAYGRGELVRLDSTSPFLGSRGIALTYHENGLLKTVNAEGEGKGGAVLASLVKTAAGFLTLGPAGAVAGMSFIPPGPAGPAGSVILCKPEIEAKLAKWTRYTGEVGAMEAQIAAGQVLTGQQQALYESRKTSVAELEKALTLSTSVKLTVAQAADPAHRREDRFDDYRARLPEGFERAGEQMVRYAHVAPLDLGKWFDGSPPRIEEGGEHGFCVRYSVAVADIQAAVPVPTLGVRQWHKEKVSNFRLNQNRLQDRFVYLRPIDMEVELREGKAQDGVKPGTGDAATCKERFADLEKEGAKTVAVPQLSGYFILPLGSGLFESKSTAAEFAPDGRIISLSHKGTGAGASFAEALAGTLTAAETLRDAETKSIQRKIERKKAEDELDALLHPGPTSKVLNPDGSAVSQ